MFIATCVEISLYTLTGLLCEFFSYFLYFVCMCVCVCVCVCVCMHLCLHAVSEALSYIGLQDLMSRSHLTGGPIVHHITLCLGNMAVHGQTSSEQGDHEGLLPLLQLLRDLVTMVII